MSEDGDDECYICLCPCKEKSPCECASAVHAECLKAYLELSRHNTCTICHRRFQFIQPVLQQHRCIKWFMRAVLAFCIYLFSGYIGNAVLFKIGVVKSFPDGSFWTNEHFFSVWITLSTIGCLYILWKICRMCSI